MQITQKTRSSPQSRRRKRALIYFYILLVLLLLCTAATYTWFSLSRAPLVSDLALYVNAPTGLELSPDPMAKEWTLQLDFSQLVSQSAPLRPITWANRENRFYSVSYGLDGRVADVNEPLNDDRHANKDNADGYYIKGTFYARTGQDTTVSLASAIEVEEGVSGSGTYVIGTPIWNPSELRHENGGNGAELAIRIGILVEKTDMQGNLKDQPAEFYIYEPNADRHIDGDEETKYVPTASFHGDATLVPEDNLIVQTMNSWTETSPVQRDVVVRDLGDFTTETDLFSIHTNELARISVYVWLEGQDIDCINAIGYSAELQANIQFATTNDNQSGMQPIN